MNTLNFQGIKGWFIRTLRSSSIGMGVWVYLDGNVLIDAGFTRACGRVMEIYDSVHPRALVLTHAHEDHAGCTRDLAGKGVQVIVPGVLRGDLLRLGATRLPFYRRFIWGQPRIPELGAFEEQNEWVDGKTSLRYIHTPGHSVSHHVIWDGEMGIVFLGDLYLGPRMTMAHPWEDPRMIAESLRQVRALNPEAAFCAHRGLLRHPVTAFTRKIEYIEWMIERTLELAAKGMTTSEIAGQLLGREKLVSRLTSGLYSRENVIESILNGPKSEFQGKL